MRRTPARPQGLRLGIDLANQKRRVLLLGAALPYSLLATCLAVERCLHLALISRPVQGIVGCPSPSRVLAHMGHVASQDSVHP